MAAVNLTGTLRVSREGELEGLDIHEHGIPAYPEYMLTPSATHMGTPGVHGATGLSADGAHHDP